MLGLAAVAACRFAPVAATGDDGGMQDGIAIDGMRDAHIGNEPGAICFGSQDIDMVCPATISTTPLMITANLALDTDDASCTAASANGVDVCVIQGTSITIADHIAVTVHGSRPLVLLATGTAGMIMVGGPMAVLDVSSHLGGQEGAASLTGSKCSLQATAASGKGGGAGGSDAGLGGAGGADNTNSGGGISGAALTNPTSLHGGCNGAVGIGATLAFGGGAVALIAPTIHIDGTITASGSGGAGAPTNGGGGGGGAGGLNVVDAPTINGMVSIFSIVGG